MNDNEKEFVLSEDGYNSYTNDGYMDKEIINASYSPINDKNIPIDTFKGNRAWNNENSLMKTQRAEGSLITWTREELYD